MVKVGNWYKESRDRADLPALFCVESVDANYFTAYTGHIVTGKSAIHRYNYNGQYIGYVNRDEFYPGKYWGCNLLLGHDLKFTHGEKEELDELVERAPDLESSMFYHIYACFLFDRYTQRDPQWQPENPMPVYENEWIGNIYRKRIIQSLNSGRRVCLLALEDEAELWAMVKKRTVRNGSYVYKCSDWTPISEDWTPSK